MKPTIHGLLTLAGILALNLVPMVPCSTIDDARELVRLMPHFHVLSVEKEDSPVELLVERDTDHHVVRMRAVCKAGSGACLYKFADTGITSAFRERQFTAW